MNTYLIVTTDKITIDEKIKELNEDNTADIVNYDLLETNISRLIEDLDTINFLSSKKIVVGSNAYFLSSERVKSTIEHNLDILDHYLDNPSSDNILILVTPSIDKRKKITSNILKKCELIEEIEDINYLIKKRLDDYTINSDALDKLIEYSGNNHEKIFNEIEKLKLYKLDDKKITSSDIEEVVMKVLDDNIFHFVDSILSGNKEYAFKLYHNFILHGETVIGLMPSLYSKIKLMYQIKVLAKAGKNNKEMATLLKVHEYRVKLAYQEGYRYSEKTLLDILEKIAKLDLEIKSGKSSGEVEFETLLATI